MSLLEVMVAFVIAALSLGAVINGTVDGLRTTSSATRTEEALFHARSRLAATAAAPVVAIASGDMGAVASGDMGVVASGDVGAVASGDDGGGFRWRSTVSPVVAGAREGGPRLMSVQVTVSWDGTGGTVRQVTLRTERLVAAATK